MNAFAHPTPLAGSTNVDSSSFAIARDQLNAQLWSLVLAVVAASILGIIFSFSANQAIEISRMGVKLNVERATAARGLAALIIILALLHIIVVSLTTREWRRQIKRIEEQRYTEAVEELQNQLGRALKPEEEPSQPQIEGRAGGWILILLILLVPLLFAIEALYQIIPEAT
jgi:hypothetical protein